MRIFSKLQGVVLFLLPFWVLSSPWEPPDEIEKAVQEMSTEQLTTTLKKLIDPELNPVLHNLTQQYAPHCSSANNNRVLGRTESYTVRHDTRTPPWTVAVEAIRYANTMQALHQKPNVCDNIDTFLESVASGSRLCPLHLLSPIEICKTFNQYSHVYWLGDSLSRHMAMALLSVLVSNLRQGAFPRNVGNFSNCQCDGSYSEAAECRLHGDVVLPAAITQVCKGLLPRRFNTVFGMVSTKKGVLPGLLSEKPLRCNEMDSRPIFLFLQAGRSQDTAEEEKALLIPRLNHIYGYLVACRHTPPPALVQMFGRSVIQPKYGMKQVRLGFTGGCVQHRRYDAHFPAQSREQFMQNNNAWRDVIRSRYRGMMHFLDFYNLTMQPPAESSDGYHYLSATNIEKANAIVRLMGLLAKQK